MGQDSLLLLPDRLSVPLEEVHILVDIIILIMIVNLSIPAGTTIVCSTFSVLQMYLAFLNYLVPSYDTVIFLLNDRSPLFLFLSFGLAHGDSQLVPEGLHEVLEHGIPKELRPAEGKVGATRTLVP